MSNADDSGLRRLVLVLGDQLDRTSAAFDGFRPDDDAVLMIEARAEASCPRQHAHRLVLFFSAMRHFRDELRERGLKVHYSQLDDPDTPATFAEEIRRHVHQLRPETLTLTVVHPGDHRVRTEIHTAIDELPAELDERPDRHFLCDEDEFADYAEGRSTLLMETFYRRMRRRHGVLLTDDGEPVGGQWNFDADNRATFGPEGPPHIKAPRSFRQDRLTSAAAAMVAKEFPSSPGTPATFDYPVTAAQARTALRDFVDHRLTNFGRYQDAMVSGRPYLYHSRLSSALNLHLLDPSDAISAAVDALSSDDAPLSSVEGFVRQVLGWREFVRGVYWREMPSYAEANALGADLPIPAFFWTAETSMNCVRECVSQLVDHAYAHHIQRLMVLGLLALLLGVRPREVNRWHHSMYIDAVDWVSTPNVIGMSQYADGGLLATKPYCASGSYIDRMSDYCRDCRFDPKQATGDDACPFTTLYWDFLSRHRNRLRHNHRMGLQLRHLDRKSSSDRRSIRRRADRLKNELCADAPG